MDYEKKYNEALKRAKDFMNGIVQFAIDPGESIVLYIFPELRESEDEWIRKAIIELLKEVEEDETYTGRQHIPDMLSYLEKQKVTPMPNSTELIEMWHKVKAILKEKDFRGDEWRLAQNAFMDGFARGTCVKSEKQKEQKPALSEVELLFRGEKVTVKRPFYRDDKGRGYSTAELDEDVAWNALRAWCEKKGISLYDLYPKAEWSEEDEKIKSCIGLALTDVDEQRFKDFGTTLKDCLSWLEEQKPTGWSEEDVPSREMILAIWELGNAWKERPVPEISQLKFIQDHWKESSYFNKLKSLRPQPKQEWSEEDERILRGIIGKIDHDQTYGVSKDEMLNFLKKL